MVFGNGVKNIQAAAYNGARKAYFCWIITEGSKCWEKVKTDDINYG